MVARGSGHALRLLTLLEELPTFYNLGWDVGSVVMIRISMENRVEKAPCIIVTD